MSAKSLLQFRLKGDYGHFGLRYATTSSPTHMIPPRHTIAGIIGAILGLDRDKVASTFHPDLCDIGIRVEAPLSTLRVPIKLLKIKGTALNTFRNVKEHNIVPFQFLRDPSYIIYFDHENVELKETLKGMLIEHKCIYPPSLGLASLLADFEWLGEIKVTEVQEGNVSIISAFPVDEVSVFPGKENSVVFERFARYLDENRQGYDFHRIMVDVTGAPLEGKLNTQKLAKAYKTNSNQVVFLW